MKLQCKVCNEKPFYIYMVKNEVWAAAGLRKDENVCIPCLGKLLNREVTLDDFTKEPFCNQLIFVRGIPGFISFWERALTSRMIQNK